MNRPTEKDIETTKDGWYVLPCDGTCDYDVPFHRFLYYTKKEVLSLWRRSHPKRMSEATAVWRKAIEEGKEG